MFNNSKLCDIIVWSFPAKNEPVSSILTNFTLGLIKDSDVSLLLIGSTEIIVSFGIYHFKVYCIAL